MAALNAPIAEAHGNSHLDTDEALLARVGAGDERAFRTLYDRYFQRVYNFLDKRLRNRADTEETTQEVFVNLFGSLDSYRADAPFAAWVFGVTRRTLANRFKRKRHPTVPLLDSELENNDWAATDSSGDPLAIYECRERADRLHKTMEFELSPEQRQLVQLHHFEECSIQDIARRLHKSEDAIKSNLYRARKLLLAR
jgi:RNA polymerase sigma-70 factor (ECF subfamily)